MGSVKHKLWDLENRGLLLDGCIMISPTVPAAVVHVHFDSKEGPTWEKNSSLFVLFPVSSMLMGSKPMTVSI